MSGIPPFLGGKKISGTFGNEYLGYLNSHFQGAGGQTDLVAYFFRRAAELIRKGTIGLIATKTIAKGDTRNPVLASCAVMVGTFTPPRGGFLGRVSGRHH